MPRTVSEKIARAVNRELTDTGERIAMYTPALPQHPDKFHVLGQGATMKLDAPIRAILLSDSCAIDTALGVERDGRRVHGRLLFAPIVPASDLQLESLTNRPIFGRFPMLKNGRLSGAVAELRHCFMVDARDVRKEDRIVALTDEGAEELETAWDAWALRRGPLVIEHNMQKLASTLNDGGVDTSDQDAAVGTVEQALVAAWRLEGGALRAAADSPEPDLEALGRLVAGLKELEEAAREAHERLSRIVQ